MNILNGMKSFFEKLSPLSGNTMGDSMSAPIDDILAKDDKAYKVELSQEGLDTAIEERLE